MVEYLQVKNWELFQQYKDREPKWIKVYRTLLMDYKYEQLTDAEFGVLVKIWLLASQLSNNIPNDPSFIQRKCGLSSKPNIDKYLQLDFLQLNGSYNSVQECTETYLETDKIREEKDICTLYGEFQNVKLSDDEYQKLKSRFGNDKALQKIEDLSTYLQSKGKRYKDHYATILSWARKDGDTGQQFKAPQETPTPEYLKELVQNIGKKI